MPQTAKQELPHEPQFEPQLEPQAQGAGAGAATGAAGAGSAPASKVVVISKSAAFTWFLPWGHPCLGCGRNAWMRSQMWSRQREPTGMPRRTSTAAHSCRTHHAASALVFGLEDHASLAILPQDSKPRKTPRTWYNRPFGFSFHDRCFRD